MRDIAHKCSTLRAAQARATLRVSPETLRLLRAGQLPKGDPLPVARVAAIQAAKNTSQIIPYCHPIPIDFVGIDFEIGPDSIAVNATVKAIYKTGVEMEALTSASVAALTLYDMMKIVDENMEITGVRLLEKTGGKSSFKDELAPGLRAAVLVMSDSISAGQNEDISGRLIAERLKQAGLTLGAYRIIPDDRELIEKTLIGYADHEKLDLVITSGGTGLSARDNTPEATRRVIERELPGISEAARSYGQQRIPFAMLARGVCGLRGRTLIINIPGSRTGTADYLEVLFPAVLHALRIAQDEGHGNWKKPAKPGT